MYAVVETGGNTSGRIKVGDKVVSYPNLTCRVCYECTSGREYDCFNRQVWGFQTGPLWGGFAQYTHLPEVNAIKLPDGVSFVDAAAISMVGMTSWHMLVTRSNIKPGQKVLIMGGGSGMGIAGIQIAKLFNCDVVATAGNAKKMEKCIELGADHVVNHREEGWHKKVRQWAGKDGIDIIYEHIGKTVFPQSLGLLKMGGTLVSTGATTGYDSPIDLRYLFFRGINLRFRRRTVEEDIGDNRGTRQLRQRIGSDLQGEPGDLIITANDPVSAALERAQQIALNRRDGFALNADFVFAEPGLHHPWDSQSDENQRRAVGSGMINNLGRDFPAALRRGRDRSQQEQGGKGDFTQITAGG